jgi:hypothetical protein
LPRPCHAAPRRSPRRPRLTNSRRRNGCASPHRGRRSRRASGAKRSTTSSNPGGVAKTPSATHRGRHRRPRTKPLTIPRPKRRLLRPSRQRRRRRHPLMRPLSPSATIGLMMVIIMVIVVMMIMVIVVMFRGTVGLSNQHASRARLSESPRPIENETQSFFFFFCWFFFCVAMVFIFKKT